MTNCHHEASLCWLISIPGGYIVSVNKMEHITMSWTKDCPPDESVPSCTSELDNCLIMTRGNDVVLGLSPAFWELPF